MELYGARVITGLSEHGKEASYLVAETTEVSSLLVEKKEPPPSHIRNISATWFRYALMVLVGLFLSPFIVRSVGTSAFGVWVLVGSVTGTLGLFDLGVRSAVTRFIAFEHARGDHNAASAIASTARLLFFVSGAMVLLTAGVLATRIDHWFKIPPELSVSAGLVLVIVAATVVLNIAIGLYSGTLTALQRLEQIAFVDIGIEVLRIALIVVVLMMGAGLIGLALVGFLLWLIRYRKYQQLVRRYYPELRVSFTMPEASSVRRILSVSGYSTLIFASVVATANATNLIVGALLPMKMIAYYSIGATLPVYAMALSDPIAQTVQPRASRLDAYGDAEGLRQLILSTGRYTSLLLLPIIVTFIVRGRSFIDIWMGREFSGPSGDVLVILAIGLVFATPRYIIQSSLVGTGRHAKLAPWYIAEAICVAALTYVLVRHFGIVGAALAVVGIGAIVSTVVVPQICNRQFGLPLKAIAQNLLLTPVLAMIPFALSSKVVDMYWQASSYVLFFAQVLICLPIAAVGVWAFGLNAHERQKMKSAVGTFILTEARRLYGRIQR